MKVSNDLIQISEEVLSWEKAIEKGTQLLVNNNLCTTELSQEIIKSVHEFGPYFVLLPKLALAHTKPGEYIKENGMSLVVFKNEVKFSKFEKHNVNLLFTLSAKDETSHMDLLVKFATLFQEDETLVEKILSLNDVELVRQELKGLL
ncbi:MAG: PTS sugar transporter subunit IIA [Mycoplasmataceae bacterium]|nr:PTS sugar transporter subunit IIA [Mycoplasmataceae bacterium]